MCGIIGLIDKTKQIIISYKKLISIIASPIGINDFLVNSLDEQFDAFEKLYLDEKLRVKMDKNNFEKIEDEFNYDKSCNKYIKLIHKVSK